MADGAESNNTAILDRGVTKLKLALAARREFDEELEAAYKRYKGK